MLCCVFNLFLLRAWIVGFWFLCSTGSVIQENVSPPSSAPPFCLVVGGWCWSWFIDSVVTRLVDFDVDVDMIVYGTIVVDVHVHEHEYMSMSMCICTCLHDPHSIVSINKASSLF